MAQIDEVLGRLDFQKNKLAEASKDGNPASVGKVVYELIDTMQQLAGIVKGSTPPLGAKLVVDRVI